MFACREAVVVGVRVAVFISCKREAQSTAQTDKWRSRDQWVDGAQTASERQEIADSRLSLSLFRSLSLTHSCLTVITVTVAVSHVSLVIDLSGDNIRFDGRRGASRLPQGNFSGCTLFSLFAALDAVRRRSLAPRVRV